MRTTITIQDRELSTRVINKKQIFMKKFYLLAAAATIMTACTNNEKMTADLDNDGQVLIGFETYHEKSTKAYVTGAIDNGTDFIKSHGGFGVWGYKGTPTDIANATVSGTPTIANVSNPDSEAPKFTTIFKNVQVWYDGAETSPKGFTYAVPKYWDKGSEYIFFAYAPYDDTNASINESTGNISIADIASIQDVSKSRDNKDNEEEEASLPKNIQFNGSDAAKLTDYLMATYVTEQKLVAENVGTTADGTNQNYGNGSTHRYAGQEQTVGFTFGHMLSKFKINLKASEPYSGVEYIKVDALSIEKMPKLTETAKTVFTQISPKGPAGNYSPNYYSTDLVVIGTGGTSTSSLYILKNGSNSISGETPTPPTEQVQEFNYYVAPSKADNSETTNETEKYQLNIDYTIHYVDGIEEKVSISDTDLSGKLTQFQQNYQYTLNILIGLNQIYFTVDAVTDWTESDLGEVEIK